MHSATTTNGSLNRYQRPFLRTQFGVALASKSRTEEGKHPLLAACAQQTPLERNYPHPLRAVSAGELPDLTAMVPESNVWTSVRRVAVGDKPVDNMARFIHVFMCKAVNHKGLIREVHSMLSAETRQATGAIEANYERDRADYARQLPRSETTAQVVCAAGHTEDAPLGSLRAGNVVQLLPQGSPCVLPPMHGHAFPCLPGSKHATHQCDTCLYLARNRFLAFSAVKEFYAYTVECQGVIDGMLSRETNWLGYKRALFRALDDSRVLLSKGFADGPSTSRQKVKNAMNRVAYHLSLMHDCNKPSMRRLYKSLVFNEHLLLKLGRYHSCGRKDKNGVVINPPLVLERWTGYQQPQDFLVAPLLRDTNDPEVRGCSEIAPGEFADVMFTCGAAQSHLGGARWADVFTLEQVKAVAEFSARFYGDIVPSLLALVGISPSGLELVHAMHFNSEVRDMPDNKLFAHCIQLHQHSPVDFHLLHYFSLCVSKQLNLAQHALDQDQGLAQARALRLRNNVEPWQKLPFACDEVPVCKSGARLYCEVASPALESHREKAMAGDGTGLHLMKDLTARGVRNAYYDHEQGCLVCPKDAESANSKNWRKLGLFKATYVEDTKRALSIRTSREAERGCSAEPLLSMSLLGCTTRVGNKVYTLCVKCAAVCEFSNVTMTTEGVTCGRHIRFGERNTFKSLEVFQVAARPSTEALAQRQGVEGS